MQDTDPAPASRQDPVLAAWLRLDGTPGVGPVAMSRLLAHFPSPQSIFSAGFEALLPHVFPAQARALSAPPPGDLAERLDALQDWLARPGHHLLVRGGPGYPPLLLEIADPPTLLYAIGRTELLARPAAAIVGSRNASRQGAANAAAFGRALSDAGLVVVSGLALGIDAAAHEGALGGAASTVAVTGTGADRIYPRANEALARRIAEEGCLLSEYALGTPPLSANFPKRNRLISGLSCAVLVVEAAAGSGSLITARVASEQGRDVFAIPGSIHAPLSKGCHQLIKGGAKLVECAADLLEELALAPLAQASGMKDGNAVSDPAQLALLQAIGPDAVDIDTIAALSEATPGVLARQLLSLELAGHLERLPGGLFQRVYR